MPTRHLDLTVDVFENQVIAHSVVVATRLLSLLRLPDPTPIRQDLLACTRLLAGVDPTRVTPQELRSHRYSRATRHFEAIHELCNLLLENETITLSAGERVPFAAFSLDMPNLFERYVAAMFTATVGSKFIANKKALEFPTGFGGKPIKLDGLIVTGWRRVVVEAKYRTLDEPDDELVLGVVPEKHVYQTVAYASHEAVRARQALIVYPTWDPGGAPVRMSDPITDFGWSRGYVHHLAIRLVGVDLAAPFHRLVEEAASVLAPVISAA